MDLRKTLLCGQCFRWREVSPGVFTGTAAGRELTVTQAEVPLLAADPFWRNYFDLETDYAALAKQLAKLHPRLREAANYGRGIHILRQEPWEALCSFILSQNNHIPRIQGIIDRLCEPNAWGTQPTVPTLGSTYGLRQRAAQRPFPPPEVLAELQVEDLAGLRCGFRAKYVLDAARRVADGRLPLEELREAPLPQARAALMQVFGVGPKVADCTLLYGLHRMDAFPVDVWIGRAMERWFPGVQPTDFGAAAGLAQQYIFDYIRSSDKFLTK